MRIHVGLEDEHGVHALLGAVHDTDHGGLADACLSIEGTLDVLGKHVQPVGPHDHFLLASLDEQATLGVALADIAGVQPAFVVEDPGLRAWELGDSGPASGLVSSRS